MPRSPMLTAFGETKPFFLWSKDERCIVGYSTFRSRIYRHQWSVEKALTTPAIFGHQRKHRADKYMITAFGETKSASRWAKDERCVVREEALKTRIIVFQWPPEKAITTPSRSPKPFLTGKPERPTL